MSFNFYKDPSFKKPFNEMNKAERDLALYELNKFINEVFDSHLGDDMIKYMGQNLTHAKRGQKADEHLDSEAHEEGASEGEYLRNTFGSKKKSDNPFDF